MIVAENLSKYYGGFAAAHDISFSLPKGTIAAFLGPNGAGKSTTMKMLTGFLSPSKGRATVCDFDVATQRIEAASRIGYLPENGPLYEHMTPREMLKFVGSVRGMDKQILEPRIADLQGHCGLQSIIDKPVHKLSKGNRQRVGMAQALLHNPDVLILDEPMTGLDPNQILAMRSLIQEYAKDRTVLLSTHIMQEVQAIANRVLFIANGQLQFDGDVEDFMAKGDSGDDAFRAMSVPVAESVTAGSQATEESTVDEGSSAS